ncbi:MAG: DUF2846 domain-containing protein [Dehalococcoidales bacterium]|nr:DUF2846 domain-containing protein [Dehalococcoidales bacterium]
MKRIIAGLCIMSFLFNLCGCATPMMVGLKKGPTHYVPSGDPNKGFIYIYREAEYFGCVRGIYVTANGKRIGGLNSGSYFVYEADPGDIVISVENWLGENPSRKIHVEAGKKYYLKGYLRFGFVDASPYIEWVHEEEGEGAIGSLTYATLIYNKQ